MQALGHSPKALLKSMVLSHSVYVCNTSAILCYRQHKASTDQVILLG